ncbi:MAG: hypothetical protein CM15mV3_2600 [Caudoviricetes sp.]|nr:MAG: hypothetical protein CM15mV3_2600 [Caudoviricetes sp.]
MDPFKPVPEIPTDNIPEDPSGDGDDGTGDDNLIPTYAVRAIEQLAQKMSLSFIQLQLLIL